MEVAIPKTRPRVVISPDEINDHIAIVIVARLTTTVRTTLQPSWLKCSNANE
jgi:mRNA-degrading endonuclease toxin of MazEF toxin-antitoxin module